MPEVQSLILGWLINPLVIYVIQEIGSWMIGNFLNSVLVKMKGEYFMMLNLIISALLTIQGLVS